MIRAIAIDDEPLALKLIENFCEQVDFIQLDKIFTSPSDAIKHLRRFPVDLLFLDIQMPTINGIDFYKEVKQSTMVIFTTAHMEYAVEGFNLSAIDYLLKPYSFERFYKAVSKARDNFSLLRQSGESKQTHLLVRADYSLQKIEIADIVLIESIRDYLKIHLTSRKPVVTRMTMKSIEEKLPRKEFVRVHRSFMVSLNKIKMVRNKVLIIGDKEIPIGSSYEEDFFEVFKS